MFFQPPPNLYVVLHVPLVVVRHTYYCVMCLVNATHKQGLEPSSDELCILWEHNDSLINCISAHLDSFAEEACRVGIVSPEVKDVILPLPLDTKTKARSLLQSIEERIKGQPTVFHQLLSVLQNLRIPTVNAVATDVLSKYGKQDMYPKRLSFHGFI